MYRLKPLVVFLFAAAASQALADDSTYFQIQAGYDNNANADQAQA